MSQQSPRKSKPKLVKELLYAGIIQIFAKNDPDLDHNSLLDGSHFIVPIKHQLIRLRQKLPKDAEPWFAQEFEKFKHSGQDSDEALRDGWSLIPPRTDPKHVYYEETRFNKSHEIDKITEELGACEDIAERAQCLRRKNETETGWMKFLQSNIFKEFDDVHDISNTDVHPLRRWKLHENLPWNEFLDIDLNKVDKYALIGPRPDLTYAFPVVDPTNISAPYLSDPQVKDFSLEVLGALRTNKEAPLCSATATKPKSWHRNQKLELGNKDLLCFPWAIVETRKNKSSHDYDSNKEEFCYRQAANASAAALKLREGLKQRAGDCPDTHDGLVIFAFTCVGPAVKLWVTYKSQENTRTVMKCIWATSLELTWGVMALRMVIENMQEWVYHRVIPEIWRWIRMVRARLPARPAPSRFPFSQAGEAPFGEITKERTHAASPNPKTPAVEWQEKTVETRGKGSPGSSHQQGLTVSFPTRRHKGSFRKKASNREEEEEEERDSEEREDGHETEEDESTAQSECSEEDEEEDLSAAEYDPSDDDDEDDESKAKQRVPTEGHRSSSHGQRNQTLKEPRKHNLAKKDGSDENRTDGHPYPSHQNGSLCDECLERHSRSKNKESKGKDISPPNGSHRSSHCSRFFFQRSSHLFEWKVLGPLALDIFTSFSEENQANCNAAWDALRRFAWDTEADFLDALVGLKRLSRFNTSGFEELLVRFRRVSPENISGLKEVLAGLRRLSLRD